MKTPRQQFVIYDIDGTLVRTKRLTDNLQRFRYAIQIVFGKDIGKVTEELWRDKGYNGKGDRHILWEMVRPLGILQEELLRKIDDIGNAFVEYFEMIQDDGPSYEVIPDAKLMLQNVIEAPHLWQGVLTGNLGPAASWKLKASGLPDIGFGVYGHEADSRDDLARLLLPKIKQHYNVDIAPRDIVIVGDTVHDARCAAAIGATSIIVMTGWNVSKHDVEEEHPDLIVDSLLDSRVGSLLGLKQ